MTLNQGPFPRPALPGIDGTAGLSATPFGVRPVPLGRPVEFTRLTAWGFPCCFGSPNPDMPSSLPRWPAGSDRSWPGLFQPVTLFPGGYGLPHASTRSAHTLDFSRPARRVLALRPAGSPHRQAVRLPRRLRRFRHLHRRSDSDWPERPICQAGFAPAEDHRLFTAHTKSDP